MRRTTTAPHKPPPPLSTRLEGVAIQGGLVKYMHGYTWPGIEYGEAPTPKYSFLEYTDALRAGDLDRFRAIEAASGHWWHPTLDRGAGAALHAAVDAGALSAVRFLLNTKRVPVNQRDRRPCGGWTPLHRAAVVAHHTHVPGLAVFEALLAAGADPGETVTVDGSWPGDWPETPSSSRARPARRTLTVLDLAVKKGYDWAPGEVRRRLAAAIAAAAGVDKAPPFPPYAGPPQGPVATALLATHKALQPRYPPGTWRAPPPPGFLDAGGTRKGPWAPAGTPGDGSCFVRRATPAEAAAAEAAAAGVEEEGDGGKSVGGG